MYFREKVITGVMIIILYGILINLPYFHLREFQGEEGRRVVIAQEMIKRGDYIVPTLEGEVYLNKPPLFNWLLAIMFKITNNVSEASARMVSVISAITCAIILSLFWLKIRGNELWILPGLIFLSLPDVIDKAIRAEIDMTFTLLVTASILSWFYIYETKKRPLSGWLISLIILSLSFLTKGIISLFFFYLTITGYLLTKKRARELFSLSHLCGMGAGLLVFSLWFLPLIARVEIRDVIMAWMNEILVRKEPLKGSFWRHLVDFPLQFVAAYMPWIGFMVFIKRIFKDGEGLRDIMSFCLFPLITAFFIFWLIPGARVRYILPLSGLFAITITAIIAIIKDSRVPAFYTKFLAVLMIFISFSIPFLYKKFNLENFFPWVGGFFLLGGSIYLFLLKDFKKSLKILFLVLLCVKLIWASMYFPYHKKNMSYYREAAMRINEKVPARANLYDYNLGNYHITFYLKRDIVKVKDLSSLKTGDYLLMRFEKEGPSLPCSFKIIDTFISRRTKIGIYRKGEGCL